MHRCAAEAPVPFFPWQADAATVQRKGQAQQEHTVFSLQLKQAAAAGGDGLHTAAAVAVTRAVGYPEALDMTISP